MCWRYLAEMTKQVLLDLEASKYQIADYRISIYGRKQSEWDQLASWYINNELYSENAIWLIQLPRLHNVYRSMETATTFQNILDNIFIPLFEVTVDPNSHPQLHIFLLQDVEHFSSLKNEKHGDEVGDGVEVHQEVEQLISPETGKYADEVRNTVEVHQGGSEVENMSKIQTQTEGDELELHISDTDDLNPWNHVSKKSHQNHRGNVGVRRGYGNGRGRGRGGNRGGYQSGHTKIYEQTGRNYNYRGRGGRGRDGNHAHQAFASHICILISCMLGTFSIVGFCRSRPSQKSLTRSFCSRTIAKTVNTI